MSNELEIKLHHPSIKPDLKGRITKPLIGIEDKAFVYTPAIRTNLAETFKRVRERFAAGSRG